MLIVEWDRYRSRYLVWLSVRYVCVCQSGECSCETSYQSVREAAKDWYNKGEMYDRVREN